VLTRRSAHVIVGGLVALHVAFAPFALTHLDFARDVADALDIAAGRRFPLEGPVFASAIHFGPVWNYVLAGVLWVAPYWLAACLAVAAVESAKFVIAYKLGEMLWNRDTGVLWATGLALPGWTLYAQVLPTHPSLVETLVLAFMLFTARFHLRGRTRSLVAAAIAYSLALHAHPTALPVLLLALPPVVMRLRQRTLKWSSVVLACAAGLVGFLPALYRQFATGFADLHSSERYFAINRAVQDFDPVRDITHAISGWLVTGPRVVASDLLGWNDTSGIALAAVLIALLALGFLGVMINFRQMRHARIVAYAALVAVVTLCTVSWIRAITPYYFLFSAWPIVTGVAAVGIASLLAAPSRAMAPLAIAVLGLSLAAVVEVRAATQIAGGRVKLALLPLFDIKTDFIAGTRTPLMPAYAMSAAGGRYCAWGPTTLHGALAFMALHDYAVEATLACGAPPQLTLGGPRVAGHPDMIGLGRALVQRAGLAPQAWLGPLGVVAVDRSIHPPLGYDLPHDRPYPPVAGAYGPTASLTLDAVIQPGEWIVVSNDFFAFTMPPQVRATVDDRAVAPIASDAISTLFACERCGAAAQKWRLSIATPDPRRVDVVIVRGRRTP